MDFKNNFNYEKVNYKYKINYWKSNPVVVDSSTTKPHQILSNEKVLKKVQSDIDNHKYKLYYTVNDKKISSTELCDFIKKNYISSSDDNIIFDYKSSFIDYYRTDSLVLCFYPTSQLDKMIGLIIAKKCNLSLLGDIFETTETNFLCLKLKYRGKSLAPLMISILTKEKILNYSMSISSYTIDSPINSPHYGLKYYFHRPININSLIDSEFITNKVNNSEYRLLYENFTNHLPEQKILYYNSSKSQTKPDDNFIKLITDNLNLYKKTFYSVYEINSYEQIKQLFNNDTFHHFIFYQLDEFNNFKIKNYICLSETKTINKKNNFSYSNGLIYLIFNEDKPDILIESLCWFINSYQIKCFDLITWLDFFQMDNINIKFIEGTGFLKYYLFNIQIPPISAHSIGLITL
jgi:hypothetical protein